MRYTSAHFPTPMKRSVPAAFSLFVAMSLITACNPLSGGGGTVSLSSSSSESSDASVMPTYNVSYTGTIEELGVSIYQQGTHTLVLSDGQFIILESTDGNLSLNTYLGKRVEVRGSTEPTVEGDGIIMRVQEVTVLDASASTSSAEGSESSAQPQFCGGIAGIQCKESGYTCIDDPDDSCDPLKGGADCGGICVPSTMEVSSAMSVMSSRAVTSSAVASIASSKVSSVAAASVQSSVHTTNAQLEAQIVLMAKQNYASDLWTLKYCTSHIAFCIPAHKNWYYKSFGATTSNLWHVEFGMQEIDALYQGPIILNLVSGTSADAGAKDGQVRTQGGDIVIFKDWTDGNHFELIADARLKEPANFMLSHFTPYTAGE